MPRTKVTDPKSNADVKSVSLRRFAGLALSVVTLLLAIGCISYLFSWKQDQSLLYGSDIPGAETANTGGKMGLSLSALLVSRWFGLGAFAIVFAMGIVCARLIFGRRRFSIIKSVILSVSGAVLLSFVLAYFSPMIGMDTAFGYGLGGDCGAQAIIWLEKMVGKVVAFFVLCLLCVAWLFFFSRKFSAWFSGEFPEPSEDAESNLKDIGEGKSESKLRRTFKWAEDSVAEVHAAQDVHEEDSVSEEDDAYENAEPGQSSELSAAVPAHSLPSASATAAAQVSAPSQSGDESNAHGFDVQTGEPLSTDVQEELPRIDIREELENYEFPSLDILKDYTESIHRVSEQELKRNNYKIRATLQTYKISVENVVAVVGPTVTLYKIYPSQGVKISSIQNLHKEIAMALNTKGVRVVMLPDSVGIEVPNDTPSTVPLKALLNDAAFRETKAELPVAIGVTITQKIKVFDLADAPHLLIAGATKQGKSVGLNVLIASLLYSKHPSELKFVFIDPKMVEFSAYNQLLHHYLAVLPEAASESDEMANAIVKKPAAAEAILRSLCIEMDLRYELLNKALVNNVKSYNDKYRDRHLLPTDGHRYLPYIVTVIDEYADLTMSTGIGGEGKNMSRSITNSIIRLAQKGRAAGIHIVLATQRPSVDIITGAIKTNFPTRIAFRVISRVDSQTILDSTGAEKLIGRGDMLYYAGVEIERIQCAFISNGEIIAMTKAIGAQTGYKKGYNTPYYLPAPDEGSGDDSAAMIDMKNLDDKFADAARLVVTSQKGSTSDLQRRLGMGYAKAGRVMDQLEAAGIVGPQEGSKPRQVLVADLNELDAILKAYMSGNTD